jgi:hypothetical protein
MVIVEMKGDDVHLPLLFAVMSCGMFTNRVFEYLR